MRNFEWENQNSDREKQEIERKMPQKKGEHTRLVIDEDSIYEIDLECMKCKEREKWRRF